MSDFVIAIDYDKCTGCRTCETVCTTRNFNSVNPEKSRIRIVKIRETANVKPFPVLCMKCANPPCKAACPRGAISDDPATGARKIDEKKCIGCSSCVYACPFGAIAVDRSLGKAQVCTQCEGEPTCVSFCPFEALRYLEADEVSLNLRRSKLLKYAGAWESE